MHDNFKVLTSNTLDSLLEKIKLYLSSNTVEPKSLGLTITDNGFMAMVGYAMSDHTHTTRFEVFEYIEDYTKDLQVFEDLLNHEDDGIGEIICHAITTDKSGNILIIVMTT